MDRISHWFPLHTDFLGQHVDERQSCLSELAHRGLKGWTRTCAIDRSTGLQMIMGQKLVSHGEVVSAKIIADFSNRWAFGPSRGAATSSKLRLTADDKDHRHKSQTTSTRTSLCFGGGCRGRGRGGTPSQGGRINMQDTGQVFS